MSYNINNIPIAPPAGSVMSYIASSGDPNGWVICNGITRTATDNRYAALAPILNTLNNTTLNTANSITPPNLSGKFLYGGTPGTTGGASNVTLSINNMPSHNHEINDPEHYHTFQQKYYKSGIIDSLTFYSNTDGNLPSTGTSLYISKQSSGMDNENNSVISMVSSTTGITTLPAGSGSSFSILPPYFAINYIMKY